MNTKFSKGFTLIELLVVIAIIGILSSVVLASLNTARGKGSDASTKSSLNAMRAQAEIVYDNAAPAYSYAGVCADATVVKQVRAAASAQGLTWTSTANNNAAVATCTSAINTWAAGVPLPKGKGSAWYFCVDSTGAAKEVNAVMNAAMTACPA